MNKIGIIGFGNMGSAIAERIKRTYRVIVFDKDVKKINALEGIEVAKEVRRLVGKSEVIILAVKPQDFDGLLQEIKDYVGNKLIISIAAGITTAYIEKALKGAKVVRVMPNLPAKIGEGMSGIAKGKSATAEDLNFTYKLFRRLGEALIVKEDMIPAITAISGSGPGFLCDLVEGKSIHQIEVFTKGNFIPVLTSTSTDLGFTFEQSKILAEKTGWGTVKFIESGLLSPQEIKKQVASKKGTTEAGLHVLKHNIKNLTAAAKAALKRAKELSKS